MSHLVPQMYPLESLHSSVITIMRSLVVKSLHMLKKRRHSYLNPTPLPAAQETSTYFNSPSELKWITEWMQVYFGNSSRPSPGRGYGTVDAFDFNFTEGNSTVSSMYCAPRTTQSTPQDHFFLSSSLSHTAQRGEVSRVAQQASSGRGKIQPPRLDMVSRS